MSCWDKVPGTATLSNWRWNPPRRQLFGVAAKALRGVDQPWVSWSRAWASRVGKQPPLFAHEKAQAQVFFKLRQQSG